MPISHRLQVLLFRCCIWAICLSTAAGQVFRSSSGKISFRSNAPLEIIEAESKKLRGLIDSSKKTFAFSVEMESFQGFNNPLQRTHFNENYMESNLYRTATFSGKIIEDIDFSKNGEYTVRAKGKLKIHGVQQERIIKTKLIIRDGKWTIQADFTVLLEEHNISIPKIVHQKIAEEIAIKVEVELKEN